MRPSSAWNELLESLSQFQAQFGTHRGCTCWCHYADRYKSPVMKEKTMKQATTGADCIKQLPILEPRAAVPKRKQVDHQGPCVFSPPLQYNSHQTCRDILQSACYRQTPKDVTNLSLSSTFTHIFQMPTCLTEIFHLYFETECILHLLWMCWV